MCALLYLAVLTFYFVLLYISVLSLPSFYVTVLISYFHKSPSGDKSSKLASAKHYLYWTGVFILSMYTVSVLIK